jgi:hypothetical protein
LEWPTHPKNKRSRRISAPLGFDQQGSPKPQLETRNKKKSPLFNVSSQFAESAVTSPLGVLATTDSQKKKSENSWGKSSI